MNRAVRAFAGETPSSIKAHMSTMRMPSVQFIDRQRGWSEGCNIQNDCRFAAGDLDRIRLNVAEIVASAIS